MVGRGQMYLLSNNIAGFSNQQYPRKNQLLHVFVHGISHKVKVACETTIFGWL